MSCNIDPNHCEKTTAPPKEKSEAPSLRAACRCRRHTARTSSDATVRKRAGCFTTVKRSVKGMLRVHCRWRTKGSIASRVAPVSTARRLVHDGHHPRPLHENATSLESWHASQDTSTKPYRTSPQRRKASASRFTRAGTVSHTTGHPRRKASSTTDVSGCRAPAVSTPQASPPHP